MQQESAWELDQGWMGSRQPRAQADRIRHEGAEAVQTSEVWRESQQSCRIHDWFAKI